MFLPGATEGHAVQYGGAVSDGCGLDYDPEALSIITPAPMELAGCMSTPKAEEAWDWMSRATNLYPETDTYRSIATASATVRGLLRIPNGHSALVIGFYRRLPRPPRSPVQHQTVKSLHEQHSLQQRLRRWIPPQHRHGILPYDVRGVHYATHPVAIGLGHHTAFVWTPNTHPLPLNAAPLLVVLQDSRHGIRGRGEVSPQPFKVVLTDRVAARQGNCRLVLLQAYRARRHSVP